MCLLSLGVCFQDSKIKDQFKKVYIFRLACAKGEIVTKPPKPHWIDDLLTHWGKFPPHWVSPKPTGTKPPKPNGPRCPLGYIIESLALRILDPLGARAILLGLLALGAGRIGAWILRGGGRADGPDGPAMMASQTP